METINSLKNLNTQTREIQSKLGMSDDILGTMATRISIFVGFLVLNDFYVMDVAITHVFKDFSRFVFYPKLAFFQLFFNFFSSLSVTVTTDPNRFQAVP